MGVPITKYSVLKKLSEGNKEDEATKIIQQALKPFNLFAFILHDPETHKEFDQQINDLFDRLDYLTGPKMLFFALVKSKSLRNDQIIEQNQGVIFSFERAADLIKSTNPDYVLSESQSVLGLSLILEIPYESLPVIVTTNDLKSQKIFWIKTDEKYLQKQLEELGYFASRSELKVRDWSQSQSLLERKMLELNFIYDHGLTFLSESLAKTITKVLSFKILPNKNGYYNNDASISTKSVIRDLDKQILDIQYINEPEVYYSMQEFDDTVILNDNNLPSYEYTKGKKSPRLHKESHKKRLKVPKSFERKNIDYQEEDKIANLKLIKGTLISTGLDLDPVQIEKFEIPTVYLDPKSKALLKTARSLYSFYMKPDTIIEDLDWSSPMMSLAKLFENEINLSLAHWMRKELGISLPDFYNKHQPGIKAEFDLVDFNKGYTSWIPPGLGQSEICFDKYRKIGGFFNNKWKKKTNGGFSCHDTNQLVYHWHRIRLIRNQCAHPELMDQNRAFELKELMEGLNKIDFYKKAFNLKSLLKGTLL